MFKQQNENKKEMQRIIKNILTAPILNPIDKLSQEKLSILIEKPDNAQFLLNNIKSSLKDCQQVIIRLKILCLLQNLITNQNAFKNLEIVDSIIAEHEKRIARNCQTAERIGQINSYLQLNVQLPYIRLLRKMVYWENVEKQNDQEFDISQGFSFINKLKDILQLKKIFHNYSCYYTSHKYASSMFRQNLFLIKKLWNEVCFMINEVNKEAIQTNIINQQQFLFICAAQEIQVLLCDFALKDYFQNNANKGQKIKGVVLLRPEIKKLEIQRKKKVNEQIANKCLESKRSSRKLGYRINQKKTGSSQHCAQKLNTEMQMQIVDSILQLQSLISQ